jgi:hypothetical protein
MSCPARIDLINQIGTPGNRLNRGSATATFQELAQVFRPGMPNQSLSTSVEKWGNNLWGGKMACREAPKHLVVTIQDGLIDDDMGLGAAVIVEVAPHRRNSEGWPALMIGALVMAPDIPAGVPAVWAAGEQGSPIRAADGTAREYWELPDGECSCGHLPGYPEAEEARRCLPDHQ